MLGYMTKQQAKDEGFTNHAKFYGLPCWFKNDDNTLAARWAPAGWAIDVLAFIHNFICTVTGVEYDFPIALGPEI